jgi:hypothetical protein
MRECHPSCREQSGGSTNIFTKLKSLGQTAVDAYTSPLGTVVRNMLPDSDENARPSYPGEKHSILKLPNGKWGTANYMGPGTRLVERLERGDPPRTETDKISRAHDIRYTLAKSLDEIRHADNMMIRKTDDAQAQRADHMANIVQANAIRLKKAAEDLAVLDKSQFANYTNLTMAERGYTEPQVELMKTELQKMEQEGYGKLKPGDRLKLKVIKDIARKNKKLHQILNTKPNHGSPTDQAAAALIELAERAGRESIDARISDPENIERTAFEILRALKRAPKK